MNIVKSESAVSPVIGTILLVAIAVVLVAIILVVVMGFSGDPNEKKVGLNAQPAGGSNATLILYGGASIDELVKLEMIDQGSPNGEYVELWNSASGNAFVGIPYIADVARPVEEMEVYDTRINVRGTFIDGTEIILLVQPMTFYEVGTSGETGLNIYQPGIGRTSSTGDRRDVTISIKYNNATLAPTNCIICYQPADGLGAIVKIDTGAGKASSGNTTFKTDTRLEQGVKYLIWGELIIDGKTYKGPEISYTVSDFWVKANFDAHSDTNRNKTIRIQFAYAPVFPSGSYLCYQLAGGPEMRFDMGAHNAYTGSFSKGVTLEPGTYTIWGEIILDGVTYESPRNTYSITDTWVRNHITDTEIATEKNIRIQYSYAPSNPTNSYICYQPSGGSITRIEMGPQGVKTGNIITVVTLEPGVKYSIWGEIVVVDTVTYSSTPTTYTMKK